MVLPNPGLSIAILILISAFYLALIGFLLICYWKIYEKAGRKGWEGVIPFYNIWVMIQFLQKPKEWFTYIAVSFGVYFAINVVATIVEALFDAPASDALYGAIMFFVALPVCTIGIIYIVRLSIALSVSFGYPKAFTWLLLLAPVYYAILAFDKKNSFRLPESTDPQ